MSVLILFTSCYKDYSCSCIQVDISSIPSDTTYIQPTIWKGKKQTLQDRCEKANKKEGTVETICTFSDY